MKRMSFAVSALAALALLAPSAGIAQANNQVGIYTDQMGTPFAAYTDQARFTPFDAYLVLTQPVNEDFNNGGTQAIVLVSGFEMSISPPTNLITLSFSPGGPATRVGSAPDYIFGFGPALDVSGGSLVLGTFSFMAMDANPADVFLGPSSVPSIAGVMAIVDDGESPATNNMSPIYPSTGDFAVPVFSVNAPVEVLPVDGKSWGGVKALFR